MCLLYADTSFCRRLTVCRLRPPLSRDGVEQIHGDSLSGLLEGRYQVPDVAEISFLHARGGLKHKRGRKRSCWFFWWCFQTRLTQHLTPGDSLFSRHVICERRGGRDEGTRVGVGCSSLSQTSANKTTSKQQNVDTIEYATSADWRWCTRDCKSPKDSGSF